MTFEITARVHDQIHARWFFELEAQSEELARKEALEKFRSQYGDSAIITVFAKPKTHEPGREGGQDARNRV